VYKLDVYLNNFPVFLKIKKVEEEIFPYHAIIPDIPEKEEMLKKRERIKKIRIYGNFLQPTVKIKIGFTQREIYMLGEEEGEIQRRIGKAYATYFPEYKALEIWECYLWEEAPFDVRKKVIDEFLKIVLKELETKPKKIYLHEKEPAYPEKSYFPLWGGKKVGKYLMKTINEIQRR